MWMIEVETTDRIEKSSNVILKEKLFERFYPDMHGVSQGLSL